MQPSGLVTDTDIVATESIQLTNRQQHHMKSRMFPPKKKEVLLMERKKERGPDVPVHNSTAKSGRRNVKRRIGGLGSSLWKARCCVPSEIESQCLPIVSRRYHRRHIAVC
ncbi:hypothetical protein MTO96_038689 [Rhipicephalus appendiculatus]